MDIQPKPISWNIDGTKRWSADSVHLVSHVNVNDNSTPDKKQLKDGDTVMCDKITGRITPWFYCNVGPKSTKYCTVSALRWVSVRGTTTRLNIKCH